MTKTLTQPMYIWWIIFNLCVANLFNENIKRLIASFISIKAFYIAIAIVYVCFVLHTSTIINRKLLIRFSINYKDQNFKKAEEKHSEREAWNASKIFDKFIMSFFVKYNNNNCRQSYICIDMNKLSFICLVNMLLRWVQLANFH